MTAGAISHRRPDQRFQRIMAEQVLYARDYSCEDERSTAITVWNHHYNYIDPTPPRAADHQHHGPEPASPTSGPRTTVRRREHPTPLRGERCQALSAVSRVSSGKGSDREPHSPGPEDFQHYAGQPPPVLPVTCANWNVST
jgi:hypothetical protein